VVSFYLLGGGTGWSVVFLFVDIAYHISVCMLLNLSFLGVAYSIDLGGTIFQYCMQYLPKNI